MCRWNRVEICTVTSHSLLVPSWRPGSGDCVTEGEDCGLEERLGRGVLTGEITGDEADVPAPGLVNRMLWRSECTGCEESTPPEDNSRKQECFEFAQLHNKSNHIWFHSNYKNNTVLQTSLYKKVEGFFIKYNVKTPLKWTNCSDS